MFFLTDYDIGYSRTKLYYSVAKFRDASIGRMIFWEAYQLRIKGKHSSTKIEEDENVWLAFYARFPNIER